jgi:hypothetical protein
MKKSSHNEEKIVSILREAVRYPLNAVYYRKNG